MSVVSEGRLYTADDKAPEFDDTIISQGRVSIQPKDEDTLEVNLDGKHLILCKKNFVEKASLLLSDILHELLSTKRILHKDEAPLPPQEPKIVYIEREREEIPRPRKALRAAASLTSARSKMQAAEGVDFEDE